MDRQLDRKNYTIGWICALPLEFAAAIAMLDEQHLPLPQDKLDDNAYRFGRIGSYNIIVACLPSGVYGVTSAGNVATQMHRSFPDLEAALMVGIAGGAPDPPRCDIRLGDVVVSEPTAGFGGVLQYDFGKTEKEGRFVQTGVLNKPPKMFLTAIAKLKSDYLLQRSNQSGLSGGNSQNSNVSEIIANALKNGTVPQTFSRPPNTANDSDRLFRASYEHPSMNSSCDECDPGMIVGRESRPHDQPYIHYGLIASGNQVMKHGITRDCLAREKNVLCFEMEAAGIMDELPSLVIRGICDYSDSHKNKVWQPYAALSAAAFAKELLLQLPFRVIEVNQPERIVLNLPIAEGAAYGSYVDQHKPECLAGTRIDLLETISNWIEYPHSQGKGIFWLVGKAGTGKSTISRTVAHNLHTSNRLAASFFFNREEEDRRTGTRFFTTIAAQLANHYSSLGSRIQRAIQLNPDISAKALNEQFDKLVLQPLSRTRLATHRAKLVLVIDALDECEEKENIRVIIYLLSQLKNINSMDVRVFLTSRPDLPILSTFKKLSDDTYEDVSLHEVPKIEHDISLFLRHKLCEIQERDELCLPEEWPGEENLEKLVKRAVPLFIYAATLCRFIGDELWDPDEQIELVLNYQTNWETSQLQMTYLPVLNQLIVGQNPTQKKKLVDEFRQIVGTIINLASPISALIFAPTTSVTRKIFDPKTIVHCLVLLPCVRDKWSALLQTLEGHKSLVRCVTFSPNGKLLASGSHDNLLNLWDITGALLQTLHGHEDTVNGVAFSPNSRILASASDDMTSKLWDISTGAQLQTLGHGGRVIDVAFSPSNGEILASISNYETIKLWNTTTGTVLQILEGRELGASILRVAFSPNNGEILASASYGGEIKLWNTTTGALLQTFQGHEYPVHSLAFSSDNGEVLASASREGSIKFWDINTGALSRTLKGYQYNDTCVTLSSNTRIIACGSINGTIKLRDIIMETPLRTLRGHTASVRNISFSPDNKLLASASSDYSIKLWDVADCEGEAAEVLLKTPEKHSLYVNSVAFSPDGKVLASSSNDGTIKLWSATGVLLRTLEEHEHSVSIVEFSPDGRIFASASKDNTIKLWDTTGTLLQTLTEDDWVTAIKFSPDGQKLASITCYQFQIKLWDTSTTAEFLWNSNIHRSWIRNYTFSPNGKILASAADDETIGLWDTTTGQALRIIHVPGSMDPIFRGIKISPDSKLIASRLGGGTHAIVQLWDTATGMLLQTLAIGTRKDWVHDLAFSPNREGDRYIDTDIKSLYQTVFSLEDVENPNNPEFQPSEPVVSQNGEWLARNGEKLVWLPHDYRPQCSAVYGSTIVLGHHSGDVSFFTFRT
ncbi:hypothetical protein TWF788_010400 [Orbilia oligospora]|uniref:NACHT domain-containing protein n=1 Tax=Orbilia oligospora TaxID=2813651 RepID=A0A7C8KP37_ORBOL|nr:hypothetical protein TWF788_010400 [Orbilia oligospora]